MSNLFPPDKEFPVIVEITDWEEGKTLIDKITFDSFEVKTTIEDLKDAILLYGNICFSAGKSYNYEHSPRRLKQSFDECEEQFEKICKMMGLK